MNPDTGKEIIEQTLKDSEFRTPKKLKDLKIERSNLKKYRLLSKLKGRTPKKGIIVTWIPEEREPGKLYCDPWAWTMGNGKMFIPFPEKWGKGEWTAKTLEDAKQMAIDFAESVF